MADELLSAQDWQDMRDFVYGNPYILLVAGLILSIQLNIEILILVLAPLAAYATWVKLKKARNEKYGPSPPTV